MKKIIIAILIVLFGFSLLLAKFYKDARQNEFEYLQAMSKPQIIKLGVIGDSMETFGLKDGDIVDERLSDSCEVGDICNFACISEKCQDHINTKLLKSVAKKEGTMYWFEGRDDNQELSFDSTYFGWMENNKDIKIFGVVIK